ncbi:hypothetical protein DAETH_39350 (plasmid) [Deinococcus aetherius]|uniref:Bacterial transcriptional activator domain-containing protein n=1 Tax=Deinococcus aetherius TaxID=200252 RepID=A0ABM8AJJ5_9DEIO|nr:AAA family ATPase [Deinococcus aetherius]BDP43966.1 hypothetical protein DAETH_39350 [Deinococcus aetherius]
MAQGSQSWRLTLLGPARLERPGGGEVRCEGKALALLAYLALEGSASRSRVAGLLWPDTPEAGARNNLVHLLRRLARTAGPDLVEAGDVLSLGPGVVVDVREGPGPGELLAGGTWPELPEFTDWLLAWRGRLDAERMGAWRAEAQRHEDAGAYREALAVTDLLRDLDPTSEDALRREMRLHYLLGDAPLALGAYGETAARLREHFGTEPLPETRQLAEDIRRSVTPAPRPRAETPLPGSVARPPTLVGREDAWAQMEEAWERGQGIVLTGEPGVGKTRLALDFLEAHGGGMRFEGRPGDAGLLYATHARTYRQVLQAYPDLDLPPWVRGELSRILPYLGGTPAPVTSEEERLHFWRAKVETLAGAMNRGLRRMVFDDVQFMDEASVQAGGFIFAHLGWGRPDAPCRTIHIFRQGELTEFQQGVLQAMLGAGLVALVELAPLEGRAVEQLVAQLDLPPGTRGADELGRYTGGNPLLLLEVARSLHEAHARTGHLPSALPLPDNASGVIASRLARLSPPALHAARAAAVLESDFDLDLVAQTLGAPLLGTAAAWEELEGAQIVRGPRFVHDLVAEAVRAALPGAVRRLLHRSAARTLPGHGAHPARVARHWRSGGDPRQAAPWFAQAAQAARNAFQAREAAAYLEQAADAYEEAGEFDEAARVRGQLASELALPA